MEDFNLHLTGDVHAIGAAHNLAAAFLDNSLHHKTPLGIDPFSILWPRVVDISDRAVRKAIIGLGGKENGVPRETEWVITVGSEVMAVLALATDLQDLRIRLGRIVLAQTADGTPVTTEDLGVAGSMTVLLTDANVVAVRTGASNLAKQIENVLLFGVPVVVAINAFPTDTPAEVEAIREVSIEAGARAAVVATHFVNGGAGAADLAAAVWDAAEEGAPNFRLLYPDDAPLGEQILTIAREVYGADGIDVLPLAQKPLRRYEAMGFGNLPVCMAKTQYSLSHDPNLKCRPSGFTVPIRDIRLSAGAGFITPLVGEMRTMPGLPSRPGGEKIDIDADGNIVGLF